MPDDATLHFGGLPTGPEVRKLETAFPDVKELRGQIIPHGRIEEILGHKRGESRYKTVFDAWRRKVEHETGIVITGRGTNGEGFRVLADGEQVSFSVGQRRAASRRIRRAWTTISAVDVEKLNPQERAVREHEILAAGRIHAAMMEARKPTAAPKGITGGPTREPGEKP